jgi:peroxiredoxin
VIAAGTRVPEARVWRSTSETLDLADLAAEGPVLLLFYLFDWSST